MASVQFNGCRPALTLRCDRAGQQAMLVDETGAISRRWDDPLGSLAWAERMLKCDRTVPVVA